MSLNIGDIARLANVSKATVSAVLNNKPGISQPTRDRVLEIVRKFNYRPSHVARSLSNRQTQCIGLVIKEIVNPYYARIMKGVFDGCTENGYTVLLGSSELSPEKEKQSLETLLNHRVDGLIISPLQGHDIDFTYLADLLRDHYPLVMLNVVQNYPTNVVDIDNIQAAYQAVSYLAELGHVKIAYFAGPRFSAHSGDRLQGYQQALIDKILPLHRNYIVQSGSYIEDGLAQGKHFFSQPIDLPTAVLCYNDLVAIGLMNALLDLNIAVPEQVSVVGFDDIDFCKSFRIPLTTVHIPTYEIGRTAAELLIKQITHRDTPLNEKIILEANLVIRNSCARRV